MKTWMSKFDVKELDRPTQSPDLNPTKHIYDETEQRSSFPTLASVFTKALLEEWSNIPMNRLINLVEVFPEGLKLL